jgi:GNAT superfamily N-acetyltransferase
MAGVNAITVSRAGAGDKGDWIGLWRSWQRHMSGNVPEEVTERTWQRALAPESTLVILLARAASGTAIGFATVSFAPFAWTGSDVAFLQDLFVSEQQRGSGAGEALLKAVYDAADERGAAQVYWMVDEKDEKLQRFYTRHGIRTPYLRYMRTPWPW